MNASELAKLDDGDIINEVSGTITGVYDRKSGKNDRGEWSFQDAALTDEEGNIVKLKLCNRPEFPRENKGKTVKLVCHRGDKGKSGVYALDETYNGKTTRKVKVTPTGRFIFNGEGSVSTEEPVAASAPVVSSNGSNAHKPVFGGTAGCAVKLAVDVLLKACDGEGIAYYKSREFALDVYQISSDLVRVMQTIEQGKLAPSAKDREALLAQPVDNVIEAAKEIFQAVDENQELPY